jgi:hypothetical protein
MKTEDSHRKYSLGFTAEQQVSYFYFALFPY